MSGLPPQEQDVAEIAAGVPIDPYLQILAGIAEAGAGFVVGLLANGMTIYGQLSGPQALAETLDAENDRIIERGRAKGMDLTEAARDIRGAYVRRLTEAEKRERELIDRNKGVEFDTMTAEDMRETIATRTTFLTLTDARILPPGGEAMQVELLRVALARVNGWWLVPTDADGLASFSYPG